MKSIFRKRAMGTSMVPAFRTVQQKGSWGSFGGRVIGPEVILDPDELVFSIKGASYPRNAKEFFADIFLWLEIYSLNPTGGQLLDVYLTEFSSASALNMLKIFELWLRIHDDNTVRWNFESDDPEMKEAGEDFSSMLQGKFILNEVKSEYVFSPLKLVI